MNIFKGPHKLATNAQAQAMTATGLAVTPANLAALRSAQSLIKVGQVIEATSNPDIARFLELNNTWVNRAAYPLLSAEIPSAQPDAPWIQVTLPNITATWYSIVWNGTIFCAVGSTTDKAITSPDGINWSIRNLPASRAWSCVEWGNGIFVAIATGTDKCAISSDGITWVEQTLPASRGWISICFNGSIFLAIAQSPSTDKCATSPDGIIWTERTLPVSAAWRCVEWNGTIFYAQSTSVTAATSLDGINWNARVAPFAMGDARQIAVKDGYFYIPCYQGNQVMKTADGITYSVFGFPPFTNMRWSAIGWNGTVFVCIASTSLSYLYSYDGVFWKLAYLPAQSDYFQLAWNGQVFVSPGYKTTGVMSFYSATQMYLAQKQGPGIAKSFIASG